jgi:hypothetical protein
VNSSVTEAFLNCIQKAELGSLITLLMQNCKPLNRLVDVQPSSNKLFSLLFVNREKLQLKTTS